MKWRKKLVITFLVVLVGIQFVPVSRSNPPVTGEVDAPKEVLAVLKRACYDCHSNETKWPWYGYVAPISLLMQYDIAEGREHLNFSQWDKLSPTKRAKKIGEVWDEVGDGEMPLWYYLPTHPEAKLSDADKNLLKTWSQNSGS
ncbi:MAG: heme-binding domain-containing protein [Planctomycetes bacterium]|nr:heme-binding domain-containing protein [Planctomycetota bacterium]MCB9911291.1 heme-binding domain-containing protein [Planctomycetota bacterium]MCB9911453.1 heme-binding domain-containing protein [Planctomycetota bacterium]HPF14247.1 heme-binding domain-containing protein [Planctomycetota bacterium]HRV80627.1 heme-binding domain-containing protein [Planctomycetota bacterium]